MKVTVSISKHITEGFKAMRIPFEKVTDLVKSDFNYSAGCFDKGYRKADNYLNYSDMIIFDVDDGLTIQDAKDMFMPFDYIIATTKSHQKDKNGIVCDRFRIILPTDTPINLSKDDYSKMMQEVYKDYPFVDTVCKDASRFYYPSKDSIVFKHSGFCNFSWEDYHKRVIQNEEKEKIKNEIKKNISDAFSIKKLEYGNGEKIDYIRNIAKTEKLLELLKYSEKYVSGQRNKTLYSYGRYFIDLGMNDDEVKDNILWINNQGDSISEEEIHKTIFKSLRINC